MSIVETESLTKKFQDTRNETLRRVAPLETEDFIAQPITDVSPPKWHLGHTTWFFEEFILSRFKPDYKRFHPDFAFLFNSYYEGIGKRTLRPDRGNLTRPTVKEVMAFREYVDEQMATFLSDPHPDSIPILEIGLNHEQQHQELLMTDLKYILGQNPLHPTYSNDFQESPGWQPKVGSVDIHKGIYDVGYAGDGFHFDNEVPRHKVYLHDFTIRKSLVSNSEYLEFIESGGYEDPVYWHSDAWAFINENQISAPLYWHKRNGDWHRYALRGRERVDPNEPVTHVSYYEAYAFAQWSGMRLPTEFEWEIAQEHFEDKGYRWEHTESAYLPYPGYQRPEGTIGEYNGKFMVNQMVLRGGSIVTPKGHSRPTYRNFFHPHLQWQFSGIRLCKKQKL